MIRKIIFTFFIFICIASNAKSSNKCERAEIIKLHDWCLESGSGGACYQYSGYAKCRSDCEDIRKRSDKPPKTEYCEAGK